MKKIKSKSEASIQSKNSGGLFKDDIVVPPLDLLTVSVLSLRLPDYDKRYHAIKITFFDQLLVSGIIKPIGPCDEEKENPIVKGSMNYDPSDYEKMSLFADCPLVVNVQPLTTVDRTGGPLNTPNTLSPELAGSQSLRTTSNISCCNVDILQLFVNLDKMCVKKRMQPMKKPSVLHLQSWDNLPLLTMRLEVIRNEGNTRHHELLAKANYMKVTLVGAYNMLMPHSSECTYTAASKTPLYNEMNVSLVTYSEGKRRPRHFNSTALYPKWENMRIGDEIFTDSDEKLVYNLENVINGSDINLKHYVEEVPACYTTVWGSFHRTMLLGGSERWLWKNIKRWKWPFEVHIYGEMGGGYSFMAFLDLFQLLYPGVHKVVVAAPLHWFSALTMLEECNCDPLLTPIERVTRAASPKTCRYTDTTTTTSTDEGMRATGADENCAFIIVEVSLEHALVQQKLPPHIPRSEIMEMLKEMEQGRDRRHCKGRGQLDRNWHSTVRNALRSLQKVPYQVFTELCAFNRQLAETRTRMELTTSFWLEAAIYVNNNFVVQEYLATDEQFEEMLMMAHASLVKNVCNSIIGVESSKTLDPIVRSARHARQLQDIPHAMELYCLMAVNNSQDTSCWRQLSTCLKDVDLDWAEVCLNKALKLDIRHPLNLITKGCMVFDEDIGAAEPFFMALITIFPFWRVSWIICYAYFVKREFFHMADKVMESLMLIEKENLLQEFPFARTWEKELGDWWEAPPLLPGMSHFYDATDLLLRLRAIGMADMCAALSLTTSGESAVYYQLVALCCRLRGDVQSALCNARLGLEKFGEVNYLRSLEGECLHHLEDTLGSVEAFKQVHIMSSPYITLLSLPSQEQARVRSTLVDLLRRHPSAYAWIALANDWLLRANNDINAPAEAESAQVCAAACAVQALKFDRRAGRAWTLLSKLVKPNARRMHCNNMAEACGYPWIEKIRRTSRESAFHILATPLRECQCSMCDVLKASDTSSNLYKPSVTKYP